MLILEQGFSMVLDKLGFYTKDIFMSEGSIPKRANMHDVARKAGVSVATVSHVINHTRKVNPETIEKVELAISELHYTPNTLARGFKTGRRFLIGLIAPNISNQFISRIIEETESILTKFGYHLLIANTQDQAEIEKDTLRFFSSGLVDGILVASILQDFDELKAYISPDIPIVFLDRTLRNNPNDTVIMSDYSSMKKGVSYLIEKGFKRIGYIADNPKISTTQERLKAYQDSLKEFDIIFDDSIVFFNADSDKSNRDQIQALLQAGCNAIVASNEMITTNIVLFCRNKGIKIPQEIFLLGYKDNSSIDEFYPEGIYIKQPVEQIGKTAALRILKKISGKTSLGGDIIIKSSLQIDE